MEIDDLLLLSGNDIPFLPGQFIIHQPRIKEIAYISENIFWHGCELLKFNKENLISQDKLNLFNQSNFNIIMSMIQEKTIESRKAMVNVMSVLSLMLPEYTIQLKKEAIQLINSQTGEIKEINNNNFEQFKQIIIQMYCLKSSEKQYNPSGQLAQRIVDKIKKGRQKKAQLGPAVSKISILSRYISILAVGQQKDINDLMNYTVYQLMDEFNRFNLKLHYDSWTQYRIAGATGMEDPEDWLKDIHKEEEEEEITIIE